MRWSANSFLQRPTGPRRTSASSMGVPTLPPESMWFRWTRQVVQWKKCPPLRNRALSAGKGGCIANVVVGMGMSESTSRMATPRLSPLPPPAPFARHPALPPAHPTLPSLSPQHYMYQYPRPCPHPLPPPPAPTPFPRPGPRPTLSPTPPRPPLHPRPQPRPLSRPHHTHAQPHQAHAHARPSPPALTTTTFAPRRRSPAPPHPRPLRRPPRRGE